MSRIIKLTLMALFALATSGAWSANAVSSTWNPVFDHVKDVRVVVTVFEEGLEYEENGLNLKEGYEREFSKVDIRDDVLDIVESLVQQKRSDITFTLQHLQPKKFAQDPKVGKFESGQRDLYVNVTFRKTKKGFPWKKPAYIGAVSIGMRRGSDVGKYEQVNLEEEAEFLAWGYQTAPRPFIARGTPEDAEAAALEAVSTALSDVAALLAQGDMTSP